jgi:hypothetical protein
MAYWQFSSSDKERAMKRMTLELAEPGVGDECGRSWLRRGEAAVAKYKVMSQNRGIGDWPSESGGLRHGHAVATMAVRGKA